MLFSQSIQESSSSGVVVGILAATDPTEDLAPNVAAIVSAGEGLYIFCTNVHHALLWNMNIYPSSPPPIASTHIGDD